MPTQRLKEKHNAVACILYVYCVLYFFFLLWSALPRVDRITDRLGAAYITAQLLFALTYETVTERGVKMSEWLDADRWTEVTAWREGGMIAVMISSESDCVCRRPPPELLELFCCCCAPVRVCVWVCSALRPQRPVITTLRCWLLVLHGLWRCTWGATHTCAVAQLRS